MTTRVVAVPSRGTPGATVMVDGRPHLVLDLLPRRLPGRPGAARVTPNPPCPLCEARLHWDLLRRAWHCPECAARPTIAELKDWCRERGAGHEGRDREIRSRQVRRGASGAWVLLQRAAGGGGALSRAALLEGVTGAERRALEWALRNAGDVPLSADQLWAAAAELGTLTPGSLTDAP